jgi:hypothetical protein
VTDTKRRLRVCVRDDRPRASPFEDELEPRIATDRRRLAIVQRPDGPLVAADYSYNRSR